MTGTFPVCRDLLRGMTVEVNCKVKKMHCMAKIEFLDTGEAFLKIKKMV